MALLTHDYYCPKLGMASELRVLMPEICIRGDEKPAGVLFLLPPQGESGLSFLTESGIAGYLESVRIAVVIPPCLQGCFTDMVFGYPFYQSLKYVRKYLKTYIPGLPLESGKCAISGFGISGMAALRWAMEEPDFFSCVGSFQGLLDPAMEPQGYFSERRLTDLFGDGDERLKKREAFLSDCRNSAAKNIYLFSSPDDPGYESTVRAAEALGARAELHFSEARSEQLKSFLQYYIYKIISGR